jgi:AraC-like DNA-binding protein
VATISIMREDAADPAERVAPARVVVRPAAPQLAEVVSSVGYLEASFPHERELAMPSGTMQLLVNLDRDQLCVYAPDSSAVQRVGGVAIHGPYGRPALIDSAEQRRVAWVAFRLGGAHPFLPAPAAAARNQLVDLAELWGRDATALREQLLEASTPREALRRLEGFLVRRALRPVRRDRAAVAAVVALNRGATVGEAADRLGWTPKRLGRLFAEQVGLTPKRFARVRRFQRLLHQAASLYDSHDADWALLAAECGYHDQPHLIHDFRELAAMTPSAYRPRSPSEHNHVPMRS